MCICVCVYLSEMLPRLRTDELEHSCFKDKVTEVQREFICWKLYKLGASLVAQG